MLQTLKYCIGCCWWPAEIPLKRPEHLAALSVGCKELTAAPLPESCLNSVISKSGSQKAALISPGNVLKMQILRPHPRSTESDFPGVVPNNLCFMEFHMTDSQWSLRTSVLADGNRLVSEVRHHHHPAPQRLTAWLIQGTKGQTPCLWSGEKAATLWCDLHSREGVSKPWPLGQIWPTGCFCK